MIKIPDTNTYILRQGGYFLTKNSSLAKVDTKLHKKGDTLYSDPLTYHKIEHLQKGLLRKEGIDIPLDKLKLLCEDAKIEEGIALGKAKADGKKNFKGFTKQAEEIK